MDVKVLVDEEGKRFVPLTSTVGLIDPSGQTIDEKIAGKLEPANLIGGTGITLTTSGHNVTIDCSIPGANVIDNLTTATSGLGVLDAHQGYVLKGLIDNIPQVEVIDDFVTPDSSKALSANRGYLLYNKFNDYLPLSGGTMTGQITLADTGMKTYSTAGFSYDEYGNMKHLRADVADNFNINSYSSGKALQYWPETGVVSLPGSIKNTYNSGTWINGVSNACLNGNYDTYGAIVNMPTNGGRVSISTYPSSNNNVYLGYATNAQISSGINNFNTQIYWDAANNNLYGGTFTGSFSGNLSGNASSASYLATGSSGQGTGISLSGRGANYIYAGPNDAANGIGGALNNLVFSSWWGVSFTTSCGSSYYNTNAVSIDCRNGILYSRKLYDNGSRVITGYISGTTLYLSSNS